MRTKRTKLIRTTTIKSSSKTLDTIVNVKIEESKTSHSMNDNGIYTIFIKQEEPNIKFEDYDRDGTENITGTKELKSSSLPKCKSCKLDFLSSSLYSTHLREEHNIDPNSLDFYCQLCDRIYQHRFNFQQHLRRTHKMEFPKSKSNPYIQPDPYDSNFYCKSCSFKYKTIVLFKKHLQRVHKLDLPLLRLIPNPDIEPDLNDPNFYCKSCNFKYKTINGYEHHLQRAHKMYSLPPLKPTPNPNIEPDPNDSNFYCESCDLRYKSISGYRSHLQRVHQLHHHY